jgi:hypothetical protein
MYFLIQPRVLWLFLRFLLLTCKKVHPGAVRSLDIYSYGLGVNNYVFDYLVRALCLSGHTHN